MSIQFILGGSGCGKSYYLQHYISKEAKMYPDRQYFYIVPEQFTMQTQRELIEISEEKGIMNIDVQSFVRLAFRVLAETGSNLMPVLDDMGKTMILRKVLMSIEDKLIYFGKNIHKTGYVQEIKSFLSEIYQYNMNLDKLDEMIESAEKHPVLAAKLKDMKTIYQAFANYLQDNYITSEEVMNVLALTTDDSKLLRDSIVCLDGFTGFTPNQYAFLEKLIQVAKKVYVTITIDERESISKVGEKHSLFYMSQKTLSHIRKMASNHGVEVCQEIWTGASIEETRFGQAPGLQALEKNLFRFHEKKCKTMDNLSIHVLSQPEKEMDFVAQEITKLVRDRGCRYQDIAVVTGDLEIYGRLGDQLFERVGIPCFIDQKKGILDNAFIALIDGVLEIFMSNFKADKIMAYARNILSALSDGQCDILDNYLLATGIRGHKRWLETWQGKKLYTSQDKNQEKEFERLLDEIRWSFMEQVEDLYAEIGKGRHSVEEYVRALCMWFERESFFQRLQAISEDMKALGDAAYAWEYQQIYKIVIDVCDRLVQLLGEEKMTLKEFKEILDTGFTEARIGLIPPDMDRVVIGDLNRTRLSHIKYLFFVGMNDSNLPKSGSKGGVLSDTERMFLTDEEYELAPTVREDIFTEQFYLYLAMTKAERHLYLTYCQAGIDGKLQNPAYIVTRITELFEDIKVEFIPRELNASSQEERLLGNDMGAEYLVQNLRRKDFNESKWKELVRYYKMSLEKKDELKNILHAFYYRERQGALSKEVCDKLYQNLCAVSTTRFEQYAACAFAHFVKYGLNLKDRKEHDVQYFDVGNIVHIALESYTTRLLYEKRSWGSIDKEEQRRRVDACVEDAIMRYRESLLYDTKRGAYLATRLKRILERTVWAITKQMEQGDFETIGSEISFEVTAGKSGAEIQQEELSEDQLQLIGRIDRMDEVQREGKSYLRIVDYKTGRQKLSLSELYYGLQLQLMIYLKAGIMKRESRDKVLVIPAGVLYYHIDDPFIESVDSTDSEGIDQEILKALRMEGLVNEDHPVLPAMDHIFQGSDGLLPAKVASSIIPVSTKKEGDLSKTSATVTTEDFRVLSDYTDKKLSKMRKEIMDGEITARPYKMEDRTTDTACAYCNYQSICRFDQRIPGNSFRVLHAMNQEDALKKMKEES